MEINNEILNRIIDFLKRHKVASAVCVIVLAIAVIVGNVACSGTIGADGHVLNWDIGGGHVVTADVGNSEVN